MLTASVVIPVRDAARTLEACLASLTRLDPAPLELVLVDNGSTDDGPALLRAFAARSGAVPVRLLSEPRRGAARARNAGFRAAAGDVVAFTDADCRVDRAWLAALLKPFADPSIGAVAGRIAGAAPATACEAFSGLYTLRTPAEGRLSRRWTPLDGGYPTANLAVRRGILERLQGFDEKVLLYGEDYDLCARLYEAGWTIAYTPEAAVCHQHRATLRGLARQAFGFGQSHAYLLRRHGEPGLWFELPGKTVVMRARGGRAWIDLASADKKMAALALLGAALPITWPGIPLYFLWLMTTAWRRARAAGVPRSAATPAALAALLLWKSAALTMGRWSGSVKHGALCL